MGKVCICLKLLVPVAEDPLQDGEFLVPGNRQVRELPFRFPETLLSDEPVFGNPEKHIVERHPLVLPREPDLVHVHRKDEGMDFFGVLFPEYHDGSKRLLVDRDVAHLEPVSGNFFELGTDQPEDFLVFLLDQEDSHFESFERGELLLDWLEGPDDLLVPVHGGYGKGQLAFFCGKVFCG